MTYGDDEEDVAHGGNCGCRDCGPEEDPYEDPQGFEEFDDYDDSGEDTNP